MGSPGPQPEITPQKILNVFQQSEDQYTPFTATEIADELGCARRTAYTKLQQLADDGTLKTKKTGARGRVWWQPRDVRIQAHEASEYAAVPQSEPFDALVDAVTEYAIFMLDPDGDVISWNEGAERIKGYAAGKILGEHFSMFYTDEDREGGVPEENLATAAEHGSVEDEGWRVRKDGSRFWASVVITAIRDSDSTLSGYLKVTRDMTGLRDRQRALQQEYELIDQLLETSPVGVVVLDADGEITRANTRAKTILGLTRSEIVGRIYDEPEWSIYDADGHSITPDEHPVTRVLETGESVFGFIHGITLPDGTDRWLSSNSAPVLDGNGDIERVIVTLEDITELKAQEKEILRQRDDLDYLNRVNTIIREIDRAIVAADTRAEIEQSVCERLATADPYLFAVIGEFSASYNEFTPRAFAGIGEAYLDELLHAENAPPLREGLGATAARTGEVQVAQELTDLPYEFWQDTAQEYNFQSYASVPLIHEDVVYGVLGVYAKHPAAFDTEERQVLGELGKMIGHAINALERKEALLAETVVELEFREDGELAEFFTEIEGDPGGTMEITRTVLLAGGDALQYYTTTEIDTAQFETALEGESAVRHVRLLDQTGDTAQFEVRTTGPTMANVFATYGGRTTRIRFENGKVRMTAELPYGTAIRPVIDAIQDIYPDMEFSSRTTRERSTQTIAGLQAVVADQLTDRQRAALEAGYYAGFFDWPRGSTGEEIAETMDVSPSTFHKHLRYGERKLLRLLFESEDCTET